MNTEDIKKAIKNSSNYWERRALEDKLNVIENEDDYINRISSIYDKASKDIDSKLAKVYARYAKENGLTLDEAYKKLPKAMEKEYKKDVMDYISKAQEGNPKWKSYLLNQSIMHSHSVLDQLKTEYRSVIYDIDIEETGGKFLEKIFTNSDYYTQYSNNQAGIKETFAQVDKDYIKSLIEENWSGGGGFSETIWKNREQLVNALDDIVIRGLATGDSYDKMADKLAKRMETSKSNAKRLIRTESARMNNCGLLNRYKEMGVEKLVFVATLDNRTSEICRAMDGSIIPIEDAKIGLNVPPLHPYCRSIISPYYEDNEPYDRVYRDIQGGKTKSGKYQTYVEYLEKQLKDKEKAQALAKTRNDLQSLIKAIGVTSVPNPVPVPTETLNIQPTGELTDYEKSSLVTYVQNNGYKELNQNLRNDEVMGEEVLDLMKGMDNAVEKLPVYQDMVYRDLSIKDDVKLQRFLEDYQEGNIIKYKEFISTDKRESFKFDVRANIRVAIRSKNGREMGKYNIMEKEVIFKRNSKFRVIKTEIISDEEIYIVLEEVL